MGATSDPRLHVLPSNHLKYLQVGSSSYQKKIKLGLFIKPTKAENQQNQKKKKKKMKKIENQLLLTTS